MNSIDSNATLAEATTWLAHCAALPADVEAKARLLLLDTFGCLLAGLLHPEVKKFGQALRLAYPGDTAGQRRTLSSGRPALQRWGPRRRVGTKPAKVTRLRMADRGSRSFPRCSRLLRLEKLALPICFLH